jgi:hypothetical protein
MVSENLKPQYDAVLKDLGAERVELHREVSDLQRKLKELDFTIASLSRRLGIIPVFPVLNPQDNLLQAGIAEVQKYSSVSIMWAILLELNKPNGAPMSAQEIADALQAGGIKTKAASFVNTVSTTLSNMKKTTGDVDVIEAKWFVTEKGRSHADHIAGKLRRRATRSEKVGLFDVGEPES